MDTRPNWLALDHYDLACYAALAGQPNRAVAELGETLRLNPGLTAWSKQDADLDSLRGRADYQALHAE